MAFEYAKNLFKEDISDFYMVGDSPKVDIAGGKLNGMNTVLVESGLYNEKNKFDHFEFLDFADHIVPDIESAVNIILKENGIL